MSHYYDPSDLANFPAIAEHAPATVLPTARLLSANGHFALTVTIAAARAALMGIQGTPGSSNPPSAVSCSE